MKEDGQSGMLENQRELLGLLLLVAADADGEVLAAEKRMIAVGLGPEVYQKVQAFYAATPGDQLDPTLADLRSSMLGDRGAQDRFQRLLMKMFLRDGHYSPEEQALTRRISRWMGGGSLI